MPQTIYPEPFSSTHAITSRPLGFNPDYSRKTTNQLDRRDVTARFGLRLREMRRERSMTQQYMALAFGIDRSFISDLERGRRSVCLSTLEVIALGMQVSLSDLLRDL